MVKSPSVNKKVEAAMLVIAGAKRAEIAAKYGVAPAEVACWAASFEAGGRERVRADFLAASRKTQNAPPDPGSTSVLEALGYAAPRKGSKTYGFFLSNALAVVLANGLRTRGFSGVLPDERGGFESRSRSAKGLKKLDVNYSTAEMGLGLGLSIKTISSPDSATKRFTKNYSRNDNELRAEAMDHHRRQPYAVLAGFLFMPAECCDDAGAGKGEESGVSSFGAAVRYFRWRTPRPEPDGEPDRFEAFYVVAYEPSGAALFWPVHDLDRLAPRSGRPSSTAALTLDGALDDCVRLYERRNSAPFAFAEA